MEWVDSVRDFCFRFSHFHPDRYTKEERPVFTNTVGELLLLSSESTNKNLNSKSSKKDKIQNDVDTPSIVPTSVKSVYKTDASLSKEDGETVEDATSRLLTQYAVNGVLLTGVLTLANVFLDRPGTHRQ
ncbi:MAG: hypothetical protein Sylvanvirus18_11 [Sylvanvirus sp.]|uniref:Uncharacterized protein n=1 Tax=Sylvanvirus sp. TaxID=2487774 RepID=A0A3G5AIN3_9VIRU|nr:MAG: hypothetical protein Sylvanvirus18_11 [Sylvanvirus sp.]